MPSPRNRTIFPLFTMICDCLVLMASVSLAYAFRFLMIWIPYEGDRPPFSDYFATLMIAIPIYLVFFRAYGLYQVSRNMRRIEEMFLVLKASSFSVVLLLAATFFYRGFSYSRVYLIILWFISVFFLIINLYYFIQF